HARGLQVQGADHFDHDLKVLVERPIPAVRARRATVRHDRLERLGLRAERAGRIEQVGHHTLEPAAHPCLRCRDSMSLACHCQLPGSAPGSSTIVCTLDAPMICRMFCSGSATQGCSCPSAATSRSTDENTGRARPPSDTWRTSKITSPSWPGRTSGRAGANTISGRPPPAAAPFSDSTAPPPLVCPAAYG